MAFLWQWNEDNHNVQFVGYSCNKRPWFTAPPPHQNDTRVSLRRGMNHVEEFCSDAIARPGSTHSKEQVVVVRTPAKKILWTAQVRILILFLILIIILIITNTLHNYQQHLHWYQLLTPQPTWYTAWSHGGTWDAGPFCQALGPLWFRWLWLSASSGPVSRS